MLLDPNIPLGVRPADIITPQQALAQRQQLQAQQQQIATGNQAQQLNQFKLQEAQHAAQADDLHAQLIQQHSKVNPQTGKIEQDTDAIVQGMAAGGYGDRAVQIASQAETLQAHANQRVRDALTTKLTMLKAQGDLWGHVLDAPEDQRQAAWDTAKVNASFLFKDHPDIVQNIPQQYPGDAMAAQFRDQGRTQEELIASRLKSADVGKATAETKKAEAETAKVQAEVAGTLPPNPAQVTAAATQANTARHERVMEGIAAQEAKIKAQAADPFGMMGTARGPAAPAGPGVPPAATGPVGTAGQAAPAGAGPGGTPTGDDFLKTLPPQIQGEVKAYAEGRRPWPAGRPLTTPYFQQLLQAVQQYDPSFDAVNYSGRNKARQDFTAGASAKQITALNTVVGHLGDLSGKAEQLGNTSVQWYNSLKNSLSTQLGAPAVTNFDTVKKGVTDELTRVWRGAGGSEADIKTWGESLNSAQSPAQLKGAFSTIAGMLGARLDALENQKQQGLGRFGNDIKIVTPRAQKVLDALGGGASSSEPTGAQAPSAAGVTVTAPSGKTYPFPDQASADRFVAAAKTQGLWK